MTEEVSRRYINGEWVTSARPEGSGPGGGVSEIVADDASIVVSNGTGPTVGLSAPGGSSTVTAKAFRFTFESDLAALASAGGVELWTPDVGDLIIPFHELVVPWANLADDGPPIAAWSLGTFQGAGTRMIAASAADPSNLLWQDEHDILTFDHSGDLAVLTDTDPQNGWGPQTGDNTFASMVKVLVSTPICAKLNGDGGVGPLDSVPVAGETIFTFLILKPTVVTL